MHCNWILFDRHSNENTDLHVLYTWKSLISRKFIFDTIFRNGSLDAFIYDTALLDYVKANDTPGCMLKTAGAAFGSQGYAVALRKGSWLKVNNCIRALADLSRVS